MVMHDLWKENRFAPAPEVFDRAHLARYTMNSADLEREIIGLFLQQLPSTIAMIEAAATAAEWRLATHTLKGSAMAVGANRLIAIAAGMEKLSIDVDVDVISLRIALLHGAVAEFHDATRQVYG